MNALANKWSARPPAGRITYVNGGYLRHGEACVHVEDRGFQLGDSIYEVCNISGGTLIDEVPHLDRMERSLREIGMAMPMDRGALKLVLREVVRRNRVQHGFIYMQVTRGTARRDHAVPDAPLRPNLVISARHVSPAVLEKKLASGVKAITRRDERWARRDIKTTQLLPNVMARTQAKKAGALEAWLVDEEGYITEGAVANAWIVDADGHVVTRALSQDVLPGVTRQVVLEAAAEAQLPVVQRKFTVAEALTAREAFITSSTSTAIGVVELDGKPIGDGKPGPLTRRIHALYAAKAGLKSA
ncbi:MAG TPA: D-amino-acid transaminase [Rhizomicrobium sp.]|nr:D-amino-acid transaminase [Rhizomicrobium sp.]